MVIDVDDREAVEAGDAGPGEVAALHDDGGVEVALHAVGDHDIEPTPGKACSGSGAASRSTTRTSFPSAPRA